ncbi:hypothetical protein [Nocardia sp. NPDC049149]|uniref:hypothetical protein n=1 Tax=Nocardia sp. NPDC049149 TaxID=3364315 RepID=UPI0037169031
MTGSDNERLWSVVPPSNPGPPANSAASASRSGEAGGKVYTFHGMGAQGAAGRLERIWAAKQMMATATTTTETRYEPYDFFAISENDDIKGRPLVSTAQPTVTAGVSTSAKDIALPTDPNAPGQPGTSPPNRPTTPNPETTVPDAPVPPRPATNPPPVTPPTQATPPATPPPSPAQQQPSSPPPQPNTQQPVEPGPDQSAQIPDRIDPDLLKTMPSLSSIYNSDGTRKTPQQQASERTAQDIVDLPNALADNRTGVTPLGGGGKVEKTITATTDGWQVNNTVTLANGSTTTISSKPGIDVEELDNGRTATTLSYQDAATQARTELGRITQQMLNPHQNQPGNPTTKTPPSVFGSAITDAADADQLVEAIERLKANPNAPIRVVKNNDGKITSLSVLGADGKEHVMALNTGNVSYDQDTKKYFEFYRGLDGAITTPDGYRIVLVGDQYIRVDNNGVPVLPDNPFAQTAGVLSSNGVRTDRPHGAILAPSGSQLPGPDYGPSTPTTAPTYNGPLRYPVTPAGDGLFFVELPSGDLSAIGAMNNSDLAAIQEIPVPAGVNADRMYQVQGGGLLIEDATGLHWATDPGKIRTGEQIGNDIGKAIATELIWAVAGEGLGYVAVRAGAKILPKIAAKFDEAASKAGTQATKTGQILDDTAPSAARQAADETIPSGSGNAASDVSPKVNSPVRPTAEPPVAPKPVANQPATASLETGTTITADGLPLNPRNTTTVLHSPSTKLPGPTSGARTMAEDAVGPGFMAKSRSSLYDGVDPTPDSIRLGTVRMEEHPAFPAITAELERIGYPLRIEDYVGQSPRVVRNAIVDKDKNIIEFEQYVRGISGMRFLDLEHEFGHLDQILYRFRDNPPIHERIQRIPGKKFDRTLPHTPGDFTGRNDKIVEIHIRLKEYLWLANRGAPKEVLDEQADLVETGWGEYRKVVDARGSKGAQDKAWAEEYFPDIDFLVYMYERTGRVLKGHR